MATDFNISILAFWDKKWWLCCTVIQLNSWLLQSNVATDFRRGDRLCNRFFRSSRNATVKELLKSVHICDSYHSTKSAWVFFFDSQCSCTCAYSPNRQRLRVDPALNYRKLVKRSSRGTTPDVLQLASSFLRPVMQYRYVSLPPSGTSQFSLLVDGGC